MCKGCRHLGSSDWYSSAMDCLCRDGSLYASERLEVFPGFQSRITLLLWNCVPRPLHVPRFRVPGLHVSRRIQIVAGAHNDVVADNDRSHRGKVLLVEISDRLVPSLLAGDRVKADEVIVGRFHVEPLAPHAETAVADVCAALSLPEIVPKNSPVSRVYRPRIIRRREVKLPLNHQDRGANICPAAEAGCKFFSSFSSRLDAM